MPGVGVQQGSTRRFVGSGEDGLNGANGHADGAPYGSARCERERLQALAGYRIVGTPPDPEFDAVVRLAASVAQMPIAAASFVDGRREWIKAQAGLELEHVEGRDSFGRAVVESGAPLIVEDAMSDERWSGHPWVAGAPGIRFYAAVPLLAPGGLAIGAVAVLDTEPHDSGERLIEQLQLLADVLMPHLERRREEAMVQSLTLVVGYDGRIQRASSAWRSALGWAPEELAGRRVEDLVHPDDVGRTRARTQRVVAGHRTGGFENRYRTRNGTYRWLLWQSHLVPHEKRFYAVAKDITDRKRDELALRESEARYRLLAENSTDLIMGHELDGRMTYVSSAAEAMTGWRPDELVGRDTYSALIHPGDHERVRKVHDRILERLQPDRITYRMKRKDGGWVWVDTITRIVRDQRSRPVGLQSSTRDVSETRRAVEALEAAREHFRRAFDDAPIGMAIITLDGGFERVNRALCELFGYSEDELLAKSAVEIIHPDDRGGEQRLVDDLLIGDRRSFAIEKRHVNRDCQPVWARVTVSVMRDDPEAEPKLLAHIEDVSKVRRHAEELHAAREAAESANRAKSEFLSRMSHELRTPLNAVLGFAQLLEQDELDECQSESVNRIIKGGQHLLELVNDVLDISSIEAGQLPIATERVATGEVVHETLELLMPLADERAIRIECDLPDIDIAVRGNRQRLKQVLLNLVSNAIKYSPEGSPVKVQIARTGDMRARIDVIDSGPGIPAEQLEKAFTPFERLGASARVEGTGLGLPVSRNLVQAMGGTIEVASSSAGSTFSVELPLAGGTAEPIRRVITPGSTNGNGRGHMNGHRRLLYIEDNLSNVELIA
jgi:PAS domain S-box-containing protein